MQKKIAWALVLAMALTPLQVAAQEPVLTPLEFSTEVDEFSGAVHYRIMVGSVGSGLPTVWLLGTLGANGSVAFQFMVSASADTWRYLQCHQIYILAPVAGEPAAAARVPLASRAEHRGTVGTGYVVEHTAVFLVLDSVRQLARSSHVRFRICDDVFALPVDFRGYVERMLTDMERRVRSIR